jgi:hypothetical protein
MWTWWRVQKSLNDLLKGCLGFWVLFNRAHHKAFTMITSQELPYRPPKEEVFLAFAGAIDAWSAIEHELMILLGLLLPVHDVNRTWALFHSVQGFRNQIRMFEAVAEQALKGQALKTIVKLSERAGRLSTKRNNLIHGMWRETTHVVNGVPSHRVMFRDYSQEPFGSKVTSDAELNALRGKVRFYLDDMKRTEKEFRTLARDILMSQELILATILPKVRP